jgi:sigma-B regulation protein RsbU (phosphoserine phosphatase)
VLFSDGIAEATNPDGEPFGEERVLALVEQSRVRPAREISDRVMSAVAEFAPVAVDDRTFLVLRA